MTHPWLEKLATAGTIVLAAACPICFPKFALFGAAFGLGVFAQLEGFLALGVQALALIALGGHAVAFRMHRNRGLLAFAVVATATLFVAFYLVPSMILSQVALIALTIASVWLVIVQRRCAMCTASLGQGGASPACAEVR